MQTIDYIKEYLPNREIETLSASLADIKQHDIKIEDFYQTIFCN